MIEDSLLYFKNPKLFYGFLEEHSIGKRWRINDGLMNTRGKLIENKPYTIYLRELFKDKGFFRRLVSLAEIISWLDNLSLIHRLIEKLEKTLSGGIFNRIEISFEYMIEMSKRMRIDCILRYNNSILLLELRTVNCFNKVRPTWDKKFSELMVYKELIGYYHKETNIYLYALIPLYEFKNRRLIEKHRDNNENQLDYLCEYIQKYLIHK